MPSMPAKARVASAMSTVAVESATNAVLQCQLIHHFHHWISMPKMGHLQIQWKPESSLCSEHENLVPLLSPLNYDEQQQDPKILSMMLVTHDRSLTG